MKKEMDEAECCPEFDPAPWDDKTFEWQNKRFVRDKVFTLFYMPINFGPVIKRVMSKVEQSNAATPSWICLSDHTSKWNMDIYVEVDKEVDDASNVTMSVPFLAKCTRAILIKLVSGVKTLRYWLRNDHWLLKSGICGTQHAPSVLRSTVKTML